MTNRTAEIPEWEPSVARLLAQGARAIRLLGAVTPVNAAPERARLVAALARGEAHDPRWTYAPPRVDAALDHALNRVATSLERLAHHGEPLARAYAARARELLVESALVRCVGSSGFGEGARARFANDDAGARSLSEAWRADVSVPAERHEGALVASDADAPESLLSRLRAEVRRHGLPFDVRPHDGLVPLAATGDGTLWFARGRRVTRADTERTVLHELHGHAWPRARAHLAKLALFRVGTAGGNDEQEGLALWLEARFGVLSGARRRELALRQRTVDGMDQGATFADALTVLTRDEGLPPERAVALAERAYRGGLAGRAGLGRERVYLRGYLRVSAALGEKLDRYAVLASGQVATAYAEELAPFACDVAPP